MLLYLTFLTYITIYVYMLFICKYCVYCLCVCESTFNLMFFFWENFHCIELNINESRYKPCGVTRHFY